MPIVERDPWRMQYFVDVACPEAVNIPTEDGDAYLWYPEHRWVYNKLLIAESQKLACGPHGLMPDAFPVFSKPIYNMRGMGTGSCVIRDAAEYARVQAPGHFWMPLLTGDHVSTDLAVVDGEVRWCRHVSGVPLGDGMFDYWVVEAPRRPELEQVQAAWLRQHLRGYTGMVNLETIGGTIIECHLRFADQWPDLYGKGWLDSLVALYATRQWAYGDHDRRDGYSVVLFGGHGPRYQDVDTAVLDDLLAQDAISSVQITFHPDKAPDLHAMPPGGFRLAIVNCWDLDSGRAARDRLALQFWTAQNLGVVQQAMG